MPLCVCVLTLMECVGFQKGTSEHERMVHFSFKTIRMCVCVCVYTCVLNLTAKVIVLKISQKMKMQ